MTMEWPMVGWGIEEEVIQALEEVVEGVVKGGQVVVVEGGEFILVTGEVGLVVVAAVDLVVEVLMEVGPVVGVLMLVEVVVVGALVAEEEWGSMEAVVAGEVVDMEDQGETWIILLFQSKILVT